MVVGAMAAEVEVEDVEEVEEEAREAVEAGDVVVVVVEDHRRGSWASISDFLLEMDIHDRIQNHKVYFEYLLNYIIYTFL